MRSLDKFQLLLHEKQQNEKITLQGDFNYTQIPSKYATGSAFYQIQNGKPKLLAYASKRLPEAAHNYSITELEMCGLAINIASFAHLLRKVDFDAVVDHLAITQIMRSKG